MAIELKLKKFENVSWGFRLTGGRDFEVPLTVIKVNAESIAENAGMQPGDVIVRVNDVSTVELTHTEAHDVIVAAGWDFVVGVERGELPTIPSNVILYETSVENDIQRQNGEGYSHEIFDDHSYDYNISDEEIANIIGSYNHSSEIEQVFEYTESTKEEYADSIEYTTAEEFSQITEKMETFEDIQYAGMESNSTVAAELSEQIVSNTVTTEVEQVTTDAMETKNSNILKKVIKENKENVNHGKKWSTFLQKPKNPKPLPKRVEHEKTKGKPYRVIIKKQPKKTAQSTENSEIEKENTECEGSKTELIPQDFVKNLEDNVEVVEEIHTRQEMSDENCENVNEEGSEKCNDNNQDEDDLSKEEEWSNCANDDSTVESRRESSSCRKASLEEQLAQVQAQLIMLSKLPSTIQETLNAVTEQLSQIVTASQNVEEEQNNVVVIVDEDESQHFTEMEIFQEAALSTLEEERSFELEEYATGEIDAEFAEAEDNTDDEQALYEQLERECELEEEEERKMREEEEAALLEQQEKMAKKEKELNESSKESYYSEKKSSSHPLTPLERPIILPGGRKWSEPNDATVKIRHPSLTDEKIADTINTFSEVITGRTMGINFLKYQPPPKSLDHLQKSSVYKMIHNMESPIRGIVARETKVLAEQDYYSKKEESYNVKISPQMER